MTLSFTLFVRDFCLCFQLSWEFTEILFSLRVVCAVESVDFHFWLRPLHGSKSRALVRRNYTSECLPIKTLH